MRRFRTATATNEDDDGNGDERERTGDRVSMRWYIARRLAWAVFATFVVLTITFALIAVSPDTNQAAFVFDATTEGGDPQEAARTYRQLTGQDRPLFEQYTEYMANMATLNWGWSFTKNQPVVDVIAQAYPYSLMYGVPATVLAVVVGFAVGLYSAMNQYSLADYLATFFAFFGISVPDFWLAIVLVLVFSVTLGWFPVYYSTGVPAFSFANVHQLVLPVFVVGTSAIATQMRYARAEALEYVHAEFVKTARAKGADDWQVMIRHVFRPALVPLVTILVGEILGVLFVAAYLTEVVFQIPGLGLISYQAIVERDTPLLLATILIPTFVALIGNLLQDVAYTVLDPRIDYGDR